MIAGKPTRTLLFMVDTSCGMLGDGIGAVNRAIGKVLTKFRELLNGDHELMRLFKVSVLKFSDISTVMSDPEELAAYEWIDLTAERCGAKISEAFKLLGDKLSDIKIMRDYAEDSKLAIILIANHQFDEDWEESLNTLFQNKRFESSSRRAIVFGEEITRAQLEKFTRVNIHNKFAGPVLLCDVPDAYENVYMNVVSPSSVDCFEKSIRIVARQVAFPGFNEDVFLRELSDEERKDWVYK